jgi:hypothetical protein
VIVGWQSPEFGRIRFGGRGLAGGGTATLGFDGGLPGDQSHSRSVAAATSGSVSPIHACKLATRARHSIYPALRFIGRDEFFVGEPQANVVSTNHEEHRAELRRQLPARPQAPIF